MRWQEVEGGFTIPVSSEETELISRIETEGSLRKKDLDDREQEVARLLVSRGVLTRHKHNDSIYFTVNSLQDIGDLK